MNPRRKYFNALAGAWDSLPAPPDAHARAARFAQAAGCGGAVLDVGCGTGILVEALRSANRFVEIVEYDLAEAMLAENRRKWGIEGGGPVRWVCGDALHLPFAAASFDCVLCFGVLPHLGAPDGALRELLRCVRPGGVIAVGHMMSSDELNAFHAALEPPVNEDTIPPALELAAILAGLGAHPVAYEESPGWYFVKAELRP